MPNLHSYAEIDSSNTIITRFSIDHNDLGFDNDPIFGKWEPGVLHGHYLPAALLNTPHKPITIDCQVPDCPCNNTTHRYIYIGPS